MSYRCRFVLLWWFSALIELWWVSHRAPLWPLCIGYDIALLSQFIPLNRAASQYCHKFEVHILATHAARHTTKLFSELLKLQSREDILSSTQQFPSSSLSRTQVNSAILSITLLDYNRKELHYTSHKRNKTQLIFSNSAKNKFSNWSQRYSSEAESKLWIMKFFTLSCWLVMLLFTKLDEIWL